MKFSIKDFSSKCDQIRRKLRIWSHLLEISLMENFIFCAMTVSQLHIFFRGHKKNKKRGRLGIFYNVKISRCRKKTCARSEALSVRIGKRGCVLIVVCTHMDYPFPIENENLFSSQHCKHVIILSKF